MGLEPQTLEQIRQLAVNAAMPKIIPIPGDERTVIIATDGGVEYRDIPPPVIAHTVGTLEDLIAFAKAGTPDKSSIWHDEDGVVLLLDESDRRDFVKLPFEYSKEFALMVQLEATDSFMTQAAFVRMLRIKLRVDPSIVNVFRTIDFKRLDGSKGDIQHGKESLGRSVEAAVQGTVAIPEELVIGLPLYETLGERQNYSVRCAVEVDAQQGTFKLTPFAGETAHVLQEHQGNIHRRLLEHFDVNVYYGSP